MDYTITMDDTTADRYAKARGYSLMVTDNIGGLIPNPLTRDQFIALDFEKLAHRIMNEYDANVDAQKAFDKPLPTPILVKVGAVQVDPVLG